LIEPVLTAIPKPGQHPHRLRCWADVNLDAATITVRWQWQRRSWRHGCPDIAACTKARPNGSVRIVPDAAELQPELQPQWRSSRPLMCDTVASLDARHSRDAVGAEHGRKEIPAAARFGEATGDGFKVVPHRWLA